MTSTFKRRLLYYLKLALAALVLAFIASQFYRDLHSLNWSRLEVCPVWLAASGILYLAGIFPCAWFWRHLHQQSGHSFSLYAAVRAHYIGQLGKYVPGKAMALLIRAELVHPLGVPYGVSIIHSFYEVFTSMAAGALLAGVLYLIDAPVLSEHIPLVGGYELQPGLIALLLLLACGLPLVPSVFNWVIAKLTARIDLVQQYRLPPVRSGSLMLGLLTTGIGWWLQGLSMWTMLHAVLPTAPELSLPWWSQCTAAIAFANVAGFVIPVVPGGFGVREYLLSILLSSAGPEGYSLVAAILLRVDWILAEALFALATYWLRPSLRIPTEAEVSAKVPVFADASGSDKGANTAP